MHASSLGVAGCDIDPSLVPARALHVPPPSTYAPRGLSDVLARSPSVSETRSRLRWGRCSRSCAPGARRGRSSCLLPGRGRGRSPKQAARPVARLRGGLRQGGATSAPSRPAGACQPAARTARVVSHDFSGSIRASRCGLVASRSRSWGSPGFRAGRPASTSPRGINPSSPWRRPARARPPDALCPSKPSPCSQPSALHLVASPKTGPSVAAFTPDFTAARAAAAAVAVLCSARWCSQPGFPPRRWSPAAAVACTRPP